MPTEDPPISPAPAESLLWQGHTSQWAHFWYYLFCLLLAAAIGVGALFTGGLAAIGLVLPLALWIGRWVVTRSTRYELTSQRLRRRSGILNRRVEELELYRVKDYTMEQPLMLRLFGLGNLTLVTSDATTPVVPIRAVAGVEPLHEIVRQAVQAERDRKRVRELDVDSQGGAAL